MQIQQHLCLTVFIAFTASVSAPQAGVATQPPAQEQKKPQPPAVTIDPEDLPVSLERIQQALAKMPKLRFDESNRPVFRVEVFGEKPTIDDILGPDWARGPVKYGSMTHQEFLDLVTPKDVQGYGTFTNEEGITVATTSFLLQWTLQKAIRKFQASQDKRERAAARREVLDALNALEEARAKAGLTRK